LNYEFGEIKMISHEDELDLEVEIYKLNGIKNLLSAWAKDCESFEAVVISDSLNSTVENINAILK
jgi:hypothetical protein